MLHIPVCMYERMYICMCIVISVPYVRKQKVGRMEYMCQILFVDFVGWAPLTSLRLLERRTLPFFSLLLTHAYRNISGSCIRHVINLGDQVDFIDFIALMCPGVQTSFFCNLISINTLI